MKSLQLAFIFILHVFAEVFTTNHTYLQIFKLRLFT